MMFGFGRLNKLVNEIVDAIPGFLGAMVSVSESLVSISKGIRILMASQQELEQKVDELVSKAAASEAKDEQVIAALREIRRELKEHQDAGTNDQEFVNRMAEKVETALSSLDSSMTKEDTALAEGEPVTSPPSDESSNTTTTPTSDSSSDSGVATTPNGESSPASETPPDGTPQ